MTNAAVTQQVKKAEGNTLMLVPRWAKTADGTWEATVVLVGRDGVTPPM